MGVRVDEEGNGVAAFVRRFILSYTLFTHIGTKTIRLEETVYERLQELKQEDETYSEAVERLLPEGSLLELAGVFTEEDVRAIEDQLDGKYVGSKESLRSELDVER